MLDHSVRIHLRCRRPGRRGHGLAYVPEWRKPALPQGAPHSAELVYVFDSWNYSSSGDPRVNDVDRKVAQQANSCWAAFADASPDMRFLSCADGFSWPAFTPAGDAAVVFGAAPAVVMSATLKNGPPPGAPRGSMAPN